MKVRSVDVGRRGGRWFGVIVAVGSLLGPPGCSLVFDTDPYRGEPVQGPVPSTPEVSITPVGPTTLDDLTVVIDTPSVDPLDEAVTYRYEWLRNDTDTAITTEVVPAGETAKGEVWTVLVTPVAGAREGTPAEAEVTIENLSPTLGYARLSRYDVWQDEVITASAGDPFDGDGDPLTTRYEWQVNGMPVSETSSALDVADLDPGDLVSVTITVEDGLGNSEARRAGPAIVREAVGWRQLEPNRAFDVARPLFFPDLQRGRMLYMAEGVLWEYRLSGASAVPWAKLNLRDLPLLFGSSIFYDEENDRFLIWGGVEYSTDPTVPSDILYELAIPAPGQETFRAVPLDDAPAPRIAHVSINDAARRRGLILAGATPDVTPIEFTGYHDDVWALDYSTTDPTFTLLDDAPPTPTAIMSASTVDAQGDTAYIFGGFSSGGTGLDGVYAYDLAADTLTQVGTLSSARGAISAVDMGDGSALLIDGSSTLVSMSAAQSTERFTYATRSSAAETLTGTRPGISIGAELVRDRQTLYWFTGLFANDLFLYTRVDDLALQPHLAPNVSIPGATILGNVIRGSGAGAGITVAYGLTRRNFDRAVSDATYAHDGSRWGRVDALSDPDVARWGASSVVDASRQPRVLFAGSPTANFTSDSSIITSANNLWELTRAHEPALDMRFGERPSPAWNCGNRVRVLLVDQTWELEASSPGAVLNSTMNGPPVVVGAGYEALAPEGGSETVVVFGGSNTRDWYTTSPCAVDDEWSVQTPSGGPSERYSPSFAKLIPSVGGATNRLLLFGGATALDNSRQHLGDLWLVTMDAAGLITTQELLHPGQSTPAPRNSAMFGWDVFRGRAMLFGGEGPSSFAFPNDSSGTARADIWEYRLPEGL